MATHKERVGILICLSATIWTLWLTRNAKVFSNQHTEDKMIEKIIKIRAWQWSVASELIDQKWERLWYDSPLEAYKQHKNNGLRQLLSYWFSNNNLVGFVDGSYQISNDLEHKAGIGGFLLDKQMKVQFIFSGPSSANNAQLTEEHAILFIQEAINNKDYNDRHILINTDAARLVNIYSSNYSTQREINPISSLLLEMPRIQLRHINRKHNMEADSLAKQGRRNNRMLASWFVNTGSSDT